MSLSSLKKSKPSVKATPVSVDTFIEQAIDYARGEGVATVVRLPEKQEAGTTKPMRRATFTLSEHAIEKLTALSEQTGIPRSKLIRIWVEQANLVPFLVCC
ncbi:ribbon-helix-helix domain-containing protein [Salinimonas marina]|uniref:Ribbon-helix-helix domain-containing protein n=1 Tax=Salinimonas marina TaxID=2785918 RepID=A0A7S9HDJ5_9ALTE|nr:ribbon-helix-helix domain-containing protein [Salinimonas marina]QPG06275.1 ribbon-helix-helix domain-containing protein [Salinimonas marina]